MVEVIFKNRDGQDIMRFEVDLKKKKILSASVEEDKTRIAKLYFPYMERINSYKYLEELLNDYCDIQGYSLEKILKHIEENGFYTPYKPNLKIEVNR